MRNDDPLAASNGVLEQHQLVVSMKFLRLLALISPSILLRFHQLASQPNWPNNLPPKTHLLIDAFWAVAKA